MRELRALGLTDDGKSLVLVDLSRGAEGERFRVAADERLRAALRSGTPRAVAQQAETRVESALSPREIQARLRAGATADEVAKAAGIPVGRVQRYEAPILAERARVVSEARRASAPGPHRNTPGRPLGALVDDRLNQEGVEPETVAWDAKRRPDGTWLVTLAMEEDGPARATWSWDPQARRVRAADPGATEILAPMPAPSSGPDSLTAVAEATGVASAQEAETRAGDAQQREALAVGDDVRRRSTGSSRGARGNGLVVLAGQREDGPDSATAAGSAREVPAAEGLDSDVPGGERLPSTASPDRARIRAEAADLLLPGAEPATRPSRQERFPYESAPTTQPAASTGTPTATPAGPSVGSSPESTAQTGAGASVADEVVEPATEPAAQTPGAPAAAKSTARAGSSRRRSAVPAWDDIMFGARRG